MLVVMQIPLVDGRRLLTHDPSLLPRPRWQPPTGSRPDFLRSMGAVRKRRLEGTASWLNEDIYCDARQWLRFDPDVDRAMRCGAEAIGRSTPLFRRWMSDGLLVFRLEVGARVWISPFARNLSPADVRSGFESLLTHIVRAKGFGQSKPLSTHLLPRNAHQAFRKATSIQGNGAAKESTRYLEPGPTIVYFEYWEHELSSFPIHAKKAPLEADLGAFCDAAILHSIISGENFVFCCIRKKRPEPIQGTLDSSWEVRHRDEEMNKLARDIRLNLLRMHAECCGLENLHLWTTGTSASIRNQWDQARLNRYLENALVRLRSDRGASADSRGFRIARSMIEILSAGRITHLAESLAAYVGDSGVKLQAIIQSNYKSLPPNLQILMKNVHNDQSIHNTGNMTNVQNAPVVADNGSTVNVKFGDISASPPFQKALAEVEKAVQETCVKLGDTNEAAVLKSELAKLKKPEKTREWYSVNAEGFKEAAVAMKDIAAPIVSAVTTFLGVLGKLGN